MVVLQPLSFESKLDYNKHRLLRAIDSNKLLSKMTEKEFGKSNHLIFQKNELAQLFQSYPKIIRNTMAVLDDCSVDFEYGAFKNKNLKHFTRSAEDDTNLLNTLCCEGLNYRYTSINSIIKERLQKELSIINEKEFTSYYLINNDHIHHLITLNNNYNAMVHVYKQNFLLF